MTRTPRRPPGVLHSPGVCGLEVTRVAVCSPPSGSSQTATHGRGSCRAGRSGCRRACHSPGRWVRDLGAIGNLWHSGIVKFVKSVRIGTSGRTRVASSHDDRHGRSHTRDAAECRADLAPRSVFRLTTRDRSRTRRARAARARVPVGHAVGSAGSRWISPAWLCTSISSMPAVTPKLPSIWNGGCASNRFGVHAAAAAIVRIRCVDQLQQVRQQRERVVAVEQARPVIDLPGQAPAGAAIAAQLVRSAHRGEELRRARRDVPARMQAEQVREVPMLRLGILELLEPLQQLPLAADAIGRQPRERRLRAAPETRRRRSALRLASIRLENRSRISARSIVDAIDTAARPPSGVMNLCSGDVDGDVTRCPFPSSTSQSRQNSAAPFITG